MRRGLFRTVETAETEAAHSIRAVSTDISDAGGLMEAVQTGLPRGRDSIWGHRDRVARLAGLRRCCDRGLGVVRESRRLRQRSRGQTRLC